MVDYHLVMMHLLLPELSINPERNRIRAIISENEVMKTKIKNIIIKLWYNINLENRYNEYKQYIQKNYLDEDQKEKWIQLQTIYDKADLGVTDLDATLVQDCNWDLQLGECDEPNLYFICDYIQPFLQLHLSKVITEFTKVIYDDEDKCLWITLYARSRTTRKRNPITYEIYMDIIPELGENYPQILQYMKKKIFVVEYEKSLDSGLNSVRLFYALLINKFNASSISFDQLKNMFKIHNIIIIPLSDIIII